MNRRSIIQSIIFGISGIGISKFAMGNSKIPAPPLDVDPNKLPNFRKLWDKHQSPPQLGSEWIFTNRFIPELIKSDGWDSRYYVAGHGILVLVKTPTGNCYTGKTPLPLHRSKALQDSVYVFSKWTASNPWALSFPLRSFGLVLFPADWVY